MDAINPYAAPQKHPADGPRPASGLPYAEAFVMVAVCGGVCSAGGALLGMALGALAPEYYRGVFGPAAREDPNFNPIKVGVGLDRGEE